MKRLEHLDSFRISKKPKPHSGLIQFIIRFKTFVSLFYFLRTPTILLFYFCLFTFYLNSQQPTEEWVARYTGPSNDSRGPFLELDKEGNSYIAGTHVVNDSINILVAKYSQTGVLIWDKLYKYPGEGYFAPMGFALDTFGNAYVTTRYGQNTASFHNTLTVKFSSSNGAVLWAQRYIGSPRHNIPEDIKIDRNNNIYVVGSSDSALLCIKYNPAGDSIWVRKYQPPGFCSASACTIDDSLNIIMTGTRTHCVSMPPPGACFDTLLAIKYSQNGELRWAKTYSHPGNPSFNAGVKVICDQFGSAYIGGRTRPNIGSYKFLTLKYNFNGLFQWASLYDGPGTGNDNLRAIGVDRLSNSILITGVNSVSSLSSYCVSIKYNPATGDSLWVRRDTGIYSSANVEDIRIDQLSAIYITGSTFNNPPTVGAILTMKYSSLGNLIWLTTYSGFGRGIELEIDTSNNIYVCGYYEGDYLIIKYSQNTGIQIINNEIPNEFKLFQNYPNPFNPSSNIKFLIPKKSYVILEIFDALGRNIDVVVKEELEPAEYLVNFNSSTYSSGVYFYRMQAEGKIISTKKFVIIK